MVLTPSTMLPLGTLTPVFSLPDAISGRTVNSAEFAEKPLLVMFICNHCPFVKHIAAQLAILGHEYQQRGVGIVAINSNDTEAYPDDAPDLMKAEAEARGYTFPYLFDATQTVAQTYRAACTPDFFLFDVKGRLVYRGQLDDSRPKNDIAVTGRDLRAALEALLGGRPAANEQKPSIGCNIKWKPGNEPAYFRT